MSRCGIGCILFLLPLLLHAQFPHVAEHEIRSGPHRPAIRSMVQDRSGLLWLGTDLGLLRTDGERVEMKLPTEEDGVLSLGPGGDVVVAVLPGGIIMRCTKHALDTVITLPELEKTPVRAACIGQDGHIWLGTYGAGVWSIQNGQVEKFGMPEGLRDEHINAMVPLPNGNVVAATDQGLALCSMAGVVAHFGEAEGAPDNLVVDVTMAEDGMIWAATDNGGVFQWDPVARQLLSSIPAPSGGRITKIRVHDGSLWMGLSNGDILMRSGNGGKSIYRRAADPAGSGITSLLIDQNGACWWSNGTEKLHRADPSLLFIAEHEGMDLRETTAICTDRKGQIWFATPKGVFSHSAAFSEGDSLQRASMKVNERTPVVTMAAAADGTIWTGTFGGGAVVLRPNGLELRNYSRTNTSLNDNVLSVKPHDGQVWLATLEGLAVHGEKTGLVTYDLPFPGFVLDVQPLQDGSALAATDGHGILRFQPAIGAWDAMGNGEGTFYALAASSRGGAWAVGRGTGLWHTTATGMRQMYAYEGDLVAVVQQEDRVIAFGDRSVRVFDMTTGSVVDATSRTGLTAMEGGANSVTLHNDGSLWIASGLGLARVRPKAWRSTEKVPALITDVLVAGEPAADPTGLDLPFGHDRITIRYTGVHWDDPSAVRFEYRLLGRDQGTHSTRDREVSFTDLRPGDYSFQVRAFIGEAHGDPEWTTIAIHIATPFWRRPWVIILAIAVIALVLYTWFKARNERYRVRQKLEQDKVRSQLEALRSQVDPHFLFNSFNTLAELIESDTVKAVAHVDRLSQFFRNILLIRDKELITLAHELRLLENYFALEKVRFGEAISMDLNVDDDAADALIVPLTLQMLVENALKHNVATLDRPLRLVLRAGKGWVVVSNPLRARQSAPRSTGFGLQSIRKRYAWLGREIQVVRDEHTFEVRIPLLRITNEGADHRG